MAAERGRRVTGQAGTVARRAGHSLNLRDSFWPAQLTVALAIGLDLSLPGRLTLGPVWLMPSLEGALLLGLVAATPHPNVRHSPVRRHVAMGLIGLVSAVNLASLILLAHELLKGGTLNDGHALIRAGMALWATNVLIFGLWYWELDRGGPVARALGGHVDVEHRTAQQAGVTCDFQFPQMENPGLAPDDWQPGFLDYMYTSFTNASAFSPTDVMPLTQLAKVLFAVQSTAALVTVGLVVARAVNILK